MKIELKKNRTFEKWLPFFKWVAIVTGFFTLLLSSLILLNFWQTQTTDPLNNAALQQLMEQHRENPNDETIKTQIRAVDLLARRAYFSYQWQLRVGGYLLFVMVILFLGSLKFIQSTKKNLPDLENKAVQSWDDILMSRRSLLYTGLGLFAFTILIAVFSETAWTSKPKAKYGKESSKSFNLVSLREQWPGFRGAESNGNGFTNNAPVSWDGESGQNILWKVEVSKPGFSSPIVWNDQVFITGADKTNQEIYCYDAVTGELLWLGTANNIKGSPEKKPKVTNDTGYAAPTATTNGEVVIAIYATGDIACWDMQGKWIWGKNLGVPDNHYGHSSSLVIFEELVLVQFDDNTGGRLLALNIFSGDTAYDVLREVDISWASPILVQTESDVQLVTNASPYVISHDPKTGKVNWQIECMMGEVGPSPVYSNEWVYAVNEYAVLAGIQLNGELAEKIWEYDMNLSEVASLAVVDGCIIVATSYGTVAGVDAKSGEELWTHDFEEGFYSSPIVVGDIVYLTDMSGNTFLFQVMDGFELIAENSLGEMTVATPAFVDDRMYLRTEKSLYCIKKQKEESINQKNLVY